MKLKIRESGLAMLLLLAISCTKEPVQAPSFATKFTDESALGTGGFTIGQSYGGGIIFYIDVTGQHGLIAATVDQGDDIVWYNGTYVRTFAIGRTIGTGASNTTLIIDAQGNTGSYAAKLCRDYLGGGYSDWFLPSLNELNEMYLRKNIIGNFSSYRYWSSTDGNGRQVILAGSQAFDDGRQLANDKSKNFRVRAIRAF